VIEYFLHKLIEADQVLKQCTESDRSAYICKNYSIMTEVHRGHP